MTGIQWFLWFASVALFVSTTAFLVSYVGFADWHSTAARRSVVAISVGVWFSGVAAICRRLQLPIADYTAAFALTVISAVMVWRLTETWKALRARRDVDITSPVAPKK